MIESAPIRNKKSTKAEGDYLNSWIENGDIRNNNNNNKKKQEHFSEVQEFAPLQAVSLSFKPV